MIGAAGDRRDDDMRELGAVAADHFDVIVVREDDRLRGREAGRDGRARRRGHPGQDGRGHARCRQVEIVLEELDAVRHCMARANPGDLVVLCVDHHATVLAELEQLTSSAQAGAHDGTPPGDPRPRTSDAAGARWPRRPPGRAWPGVRPVGPEAASVRPRRSAAPPESDVRPAPLAGRRCSTSATCAGEKRALRRCAGTPTVEPAECRPLPQPLGARIDPG